MNKKESTKIVSIIIVLAIIIGGLIAYKKQIVEDIDNIDLENNEKEEVLTPIKEELNQDNKYLKSNASNTIASDNAENFNSTLSSGNEALVNQNYPQALEYFNQALKYKNSDVVYARIFALHSAEGHWNDALFAIDKAIELNPVYTDYWNSKLTLLDDKTTLSFDGLKAVYDQGLTKVDGKTKINLVTHFARIAENNQKINEAISVFNYAKELYPANSQIYQTEIDRLNTLK